MTRIATITVVGAFVTVARTFVITLILQGKVQAVYQTIEVVVTVGSNAVRTAGHEYVSLRIRVAAELWQHIGPAFYVVKNAVVTTVVE
ncbi:hypothetical protein D3C76_1329170 [compost metagenome]